MDHLCAYPDEYEPDWVEEADACHGNDDGWDDGCPQDDGELEEQLGSLEMVEALAIAEMENASF